MPTHGDVGDAARRCLLRDPPDVLLTTPESLESMLISSRVDAVAGLKFNECLPPALAESMLAARLGDPDTVTAVLDTPIAVSRAETP